MSLNIRRSRSIGKPNRLWSPKKTRQTVFFQIFDISKYSENGLRRFIIIDNSFSNWILYSKIKNIRKISYQLLSSKNQPLLIRRNPFLVLNLGLNVLNGIGCLNLEGDGLSGKSFHENLHFSWKKKYNEELFYKVKKSTWFFRTKKNLIVRHLGISCNHLQSGANYIIIQEKFKMASEFKDND